MGKRFGLAIRKKDSHCLLTPVDRCGTPASRVLNSLAGRDVVGVMFNCELSGDEFDAARRALHECVVLQNENWREEKRASPREG
jgi:hypothetical protein